MRQMSSLTIDTSHKLLHSLHTAVDSRLCRDVVVLDPVEQSRQAPERVGFDGINDRLGKKRRVKHFRVFICKEDE